MLKFLSDFSVFDVADYFSWMTFCPEWLTGSKNLRTDNFLYFWVYLMVRHGLIG
jgi:hypothetical protein